MGVFDIGSTQSSATVVGAALTPKSTAAQAATTSSTTAAGGTITSGDFLTLLVSELKNQDPTQPTDPNAYITQLVGVNSLQQLIQINQGIGSLDTAGGSGSGTTTGNAAAIQRS
ncbi:flagellar basal-body rod modification protein FlgD [Granulicella pectinivorans]|jgi:flagellar basal-body rod modification protein FlgD|uniref:Basal-body rod modification protein FlgD n=1 Tax=Granulicella pectinivorans TaxID=474950 RepID=A0A1I6MP00_9BACT|nr:flagellar hook capping FlgD N-terminal domain-containing protein [Granulicella pectinivorans]SFS17337.1 flagellar basal-body rod modification protein FlgD [Granulicella pectinivorans]